MEKRKKEFKEHTGGYVNPLAATILSKQLWKVECKECGKIFECAERSDAFEEELCRDCR